MGETTEKMVNLPNFVSLIRILMSPLLFYLAATQQPDWFIAVLLLAEFTDVLDGFLARTLKQITRLGSHLDSWGDFIIYSTIAVCAWLLWPEILYRERLSVIVIVLCFVVPALWGLLKFHRFTSYHTWSVKLAVLLTVISYILVFSDTLDWSLRLAALFCLYAAIEEVSITLLIPHEHVDVRSVWQALKYRHDDREV